MLINRRGWRPASAKRVRLGSMRRICKMDVCQQASDMQDAAAFAGRWICKVVGVLGRGVKRFKPLWFWGRERSQQERSHRLWPHV
jgi:hypothetical protein